MRITYDRIADAATIFLSEKNEFTKSIYLCDPRENKGMINLDFNQEGKLISIEVMDAKRFLLKELLDTAEIIDKGPKSV